MGLGTMEGLFMLAWFFVGLLIALIPMWKICQKAGFNPAISLLILIPVVNIGLVFYVAFAEWPALRALRS